VNSRLVYIATPIATLTVVFALGACETTTLSQDKNSALVVRISTCFELSTEQVWDPTIFSEGGRYSGSTYASAHQSEWGCIVEAETCEGVLQCMGIDMNRRCSTSDFNNQCISGQVVEECWGVANGEGWVQSQDCGDGITLVLGNEQCIVRDWGQPVCSGGICDDNVSGSNCIGNVMEICSDGGLDRLDCAALGEICVENNNGAACRPIDEEPCLRSHCEGHSLVICNESEEYVSGRFDCGGLGSNYTCADDGSPACRYDGAESCTSGESVCISEKARLCVGGAWQTFDCSSFMGATCDASGGSPRCASDTWDATLLILGASTSSTGGERCAEFVDLFNSCSGDVPLTAEDMCVDSLSDNYYECLIDAYEGCPLAPDISDCQ
jgi:hypothetical protein